MDRYKDVPEWVSYEEKRKIEILNEVGIFDKNEMALFFALTEYSEKYQTSYLPFKNLYRFIYDYGLKVNNNALKVEENIVNLLKKIYTPLHKKNYCLVDNQNNKIVAFILTNPKALDYDQIKNIIEKLKKEYQDMNQDERKPFPGGSYIPPSGLSAKFLNIVSIKNLSTQKITELEQAGPITKILLSNSNDFFIATEDLPTLLQKAFEKVKKFLLRSRETGSLIIVKLKRQYPSMTNINKPEDLTRIDINRPQFWASVCGEILSYVQSDAKEKVIAQSAEIVEYLSIIQGEQNQRQSHDDKSLEVTLKIMETYPILFSKKQLLQLREKHPYLKLYSERDYIDFVNRFINYASDTREDGVPPMIIPLNIKGEIKYIHRQHFFHTFFDKIDSLSYQIKKELLEKSKIEPISFMENPILRSQESFDKYIGEVFQKEDEMIVQILQNSDLLYRLMRFSAEKEPSLTGQIDRFFYPALHGNAVPAKKPLSEILQLDWNKILKDARANIPLTYRISFLRAIMKWFKGFGRSMEKAIDHQMIERQKMSRHSTPKVAHSKEKAQEKPLQSKEETNRKQKKEAMIKALQSYSKELLGQRDLQQTLSYYEAKWNLNLSQVAKQSNIEMVKEKILTRLRSVKNHSVETIKKETGDMMATEEIFHAVHDREALKSYIELYMTATVLQKEKKEK